MKRTAKQRHGLEVAGKPKKYVDGGKVEGDGYMKKPEIEAAQRRDAAELVTEYAARKHASTGNDVGRRGYHAGPGAENIYDSTVVGQIPAGGGFRKHDKTSYADGGKVEAKEPPKPKNDLQRTVNGAPIRNPSPARLPPGAGGVRG